MKLFSRSDKKNGQGLILVNGFSTSNNDFIALFPYLSHFKKIELISFPYDNNEEENETEELEYNVFLQEIVKKCEDVVNLCEQTSIIGFSSGAVVACFLAEKLKLDKLILISPVFTYKKYEDEMGNMVASIRTNLINKTNPFDSLKSFKNVWTFLKNPVKNWKDLTKINVTPLTKPQTILLFPVLSLFEDEISRIDNTIARISEWAIDKRSDDEYFDNTYLSPKISANNSKTNKENRLFKGMVKQASKFLPSEFKTLTSQKVMTILKLISYCDKKFVLLEAPSLIFYAYDDEAQKDSDTSRLINRLNKDNCKMITYPVKEHNLFGSTYYEQIIQEILSFTKTKNKRKLFKFYRKKI